MRPLCLNFIALGVDELPRPQVGHGAVHGLHAQLGGHLGGDLLALGVVLALHVAQDAAAGVTQPLELAHAGGVQVGDGRLRSLLLHLLERGPLGFVHTRRDGLLTGLEQPLHAADGFLSPDLLIGGEHAVKHGADLWREDR